MKPVEMARLEATVVGRVQGVGYRYYVISHATRLGLTGWVANEQHGGVQCVVEGPRPDLEHFLDLLRDGPASAIVEHVAEQWMPYTGRWGSFSIRSSGHSGD